VKVTSPSATLYLLENKGGNTYEPEDAVLNLKEKPLN